MSVVLNPYLSFKDTAREAMEFYRSVFGGELTVSTFGENAGMGVGPAEQDRVMHAQLVAGSDLTLMGVRHPQLDGRPVTERYGLAQRRRRGHPAGLLEQAVG